MLATTTTTPPPPPPQPLPPLPSLPSLTQTLHLVNLTGRGTASRWQQGAQTNQQLAVPMKTSLRQMVAWKEQEGPAQPSDEQLEEPAVKKQRTEGSEQCAVETVAVGDADGELLSTDSNTEDSQPEASSLFPDCILMEEGGSTGGSDVAEALEESRAAEVHSCSSALSPAGRLSEDSQQVNLDEMPQDKDAPLASPDNPEEGEEGVVEGTNKFYCYLCSITCHNQQNFRSHMNSMSHQQRMMEIQHMSNACLVTLLPRVQESLQGAVKDGEKKEDTKHWCATCHTHFTSSITDHRRT
ncbi:Cip1-interacting zinc finger protein [Larimichthys crocea]|uniref:Uncharacterized protein n=1 Tax=Larimichthys crocea TaxID=215358 RepID=A0ACD3QMF5_LARCR|nr:Cip1-interacting zinc finger protein [Larimichthys crocea]